MKKLGIGMLMFALVPLTTSVLGCAANDTTEEMGNGPQVGPAGDAEPCDWQVRQSLSVGETISRDTPSPTCADGLHYYRFVPPSTGIYQLTHTGQGQAQYCDTEKQHGCICGSGINCDGERTLVFSQPNGDPLIEGTAYAVNAWSYDEGSYTIRIDGPI